MKIANYTVMCALAGITAFGCSGSSTGPSGGFGNTSGTALSTGDDGGGGFGSGSSGSSAGSSGASSGSGSGSSSGTASGSGSSSGTASGSGTAGSGSSGSATSGSAMGDGGAGSDPETDYSQTKTITMSSFTVQPSQEVFYCQDFANPWGAQVDIKTYALNMSTGSHHMFAFYKANATDAGVATPCPNGGLQFGPFTFTSQSPVVTETYPATVGATIPQTTGFTMMVHYLNATSVPITMTHVALTMYVAMPGVVTNHAGVIFLNNVSMSVPVPPPNAPNTTYPSSDSYTLAQDVNIMTSSSHMHKYGKSFISTASSGETLYTTTDWNEPKAQVYSPPLHLASGTTINWQCTDVNPTGNTLTFGESATANVMCIAVDIFYPVADVNNPVIGSLGGFL